MTEQVYNQLRSELMEGSIEAGQWLREHELADSLGVSRTPVREAVRRLVQEGHLVLEPNKGVRVPQLSLDEAVATYEVRERLETMAAGLAARRMTPAAGRLLRVRLEEMEELSSAGFAEQIVADDRFHATIAHISGNPVLAEMIDLLNDRIMRVKILTKDLNPTEQARMQHRDIVVALESGDPDAAQAAVSSHIRMNLEVVSERMRETQTVQAAQASD